MSSTDDITVMTIEEAAPHLKIAPKTLRKWLREGTFPGVKVGRKWLVRTTDVDHALTNGRLGDHAVWVPSPEASEPPEPPPLRLVSTPPPTPQQRKAALVDRLKQMKAEGLTLPAIAAQLNAEGVPTISGRGKWQP